MKKILSVLVVFGALTAAADDSYLYWMIGNTGDYTSYTTVKVHDLTSGDYLNIYTGSGTRLTTEGHPESGVAAATVARYNDLGRGLYASLGSNPTYASYVVELYNDSGFLAQSSELSYSAALADYIVHNNSMTLPTAWVASSFAIPEPNSAMLLLLGFAALGLRRRCQLKA